LVTQVVSITILQSRRQNEDDSKPSTIEERCTRLEMIWNDLPQKPVAMAVQNLRKRLQACVFKADGHFEHSM